MPRAPDSALRAFYNCRTIGKYAKFQLLSHQLLARRMSGSALAFRKIGIIHDRFFKITHSPTSKTESTRTGV